MIISGITSRLFIILSTVIVVLGCVYSIRYLTRLKNRLSTSIVLIPLYKSKLSVIIAAFIILVLLVATIINMIGKDIIYIHVNLIIMLTSILALFIALIMQRFAVIDTGIIVPYKYIDWIEFSDYEIEGNSIYFTGDKYGFSNLSSTTVRMFFNASDLNKLQLVLSRNRNNKQ